MSPRALPPPDHPDAPKYWRSETSGQLRGAVENYVNRRLMTVRDVALMRAYIIQWIDSPVWEQAPAFDARAASALSALRLRARRILSVADIHRWMYDAAAEGQDPL